MALTEMATTDVVTAAPDSSVRDLLEQMDDHHVGSVIVTSGDDPAGIVTDRMVAMALLEADSIEDMTAEDIMATDLQTIEADASHFEALERMSSEGIRRLPIVEDSGELTGIVTLDDMLIVTAAELGYASDVIEQQTRAG